MKIKKEYKKPSARMVMLDGQVMLNNGSITQYGNNALFDPSEAESSEDVEVD